MEEEMVEVYKNIYMEGLPLLGNPLKELNCYIIKGSRRNLVIDVGFDQPEGIGKLENALRELSCRPEDTDIFITHAHADHMGAVETLRARHRFHNVYISEEEAHFFNDLRVNGLKNPTLEMAKWEGFNEEDGRMAFDLHPDSGLTGGMLPVQFVTVREGDIIDLGGYVFTVYLFPGHTMGLATLYEKNHKLLFAGDHILGKITPNIAFWRFGFDALGEYLKNLDRVSQLPVEHLFCAHRKNPPDMQVRIQELKKHHAVRLQEVMQIISSGKAKNAYETATLMHWDFAGGDFRNFPLTQKWFAAGEAFAHLEYLYKRKQLKRKEQEGIMYYYI